MDVVMITASPRVEVVEIGTTVEVSIHQESVLHMDRSVTIVMARIITVMYVNPGQGQKHGSQRVNKIGNLGLKTNQGTSMKWPKMTLMRVSMIIMIKQRYRVMTFQL